MKSTDHREASGLPGSIQRRSGAAHLFPRANSTRRALPAPGLGTILRTDCNLQIFIELLLRLFKGVGEVPDARRKRQLAAPRAFALSASLPEVIELPEAPRQSFRRAAKSLRLFGSTPQVCDTDAGRALGGPAAAPSEWLWAAYAGPSAARRRQALGLVDAAVLEAWRDRESVVGAACGFLGIRTLAGYHLVAHDADGPFLIAYSSMFRFDPSPFRSPRFVYRQLIRGVRWLR